MNTKDLARNLEDYIIQTRRHFHRYPELSFEEYKTTDYIAAELDRLGIPYIRPLETGLIGTIEGRGPGKTVALRADIDALPVTEVSDVPYRSQNPGVMHACGHDAHAAMLLGAARILNGLKDQFSGKVLLVFQPAEEIGKGAQALISAGGWLEEVDSFFGAHIWSNMPSGTVSVEVGPRMAATDRFSIEIKGKSGHGSMPDQGIDAVLTAAAVIMNLQTLVSRETSPLDPLVVSVGKIESGTAWNILSGSARLEGTCRCFSKEIARTIEEDFRRIVEGTARTFRAQASVNYERVGVPLINDEASSLLAEQAAKKIYEPSQIIRSPATTGGEDFAYYLQDKPGLFAFIGCSDPAIGTNWPHHHERFNIDESVLTDGSALYAQYALDFLA